MYLFLSHTSRLILDFTPFASSLLLCLASLALHFLLFFLIRATLLPIGFWTDSFLLLSFISCSHHERLYLSLLFTLRAICSFSLSLITCPFTRLPSSHIRIRISFYRATPSYPCRPSVHISNLLLVVLCFLNSISPLTLTSEVLVVLGFAFLHSNLFWLIIASTLFWYFIF